MNDKTKYEMMQNRQILYGYHSGDVDAEETDHKQKISCIGYEKEKRGVGTISLPVNFECAVGTASLMELIRERESVRVYSDEPLSQEELSFLLWATQGVRKLAGRKNPVTFRNVPSAGCRHALETYLFINRVEGLKPGIYHYLPLEHELEPWEEPNDFVTELTQAFCGQNFASSAPVSFVWSARPYRMEWQYGRKAQKYILLDAGHVCENLYLACRAVGCGSCAIGAYDQEALDELLGFAPGPSAGQEYECAVYAASVGKIK